MPPYEVLCVGDVATDIFIRLSDSHIRTWDDQDGHWLDLPYGGKVPFDDAHTVEAGGNAANAAVGLSRLGVSTGLASHVGNDAIGRSMQAALHREGVDTHLVRFDPVHPSNRNFALWYHQDRTILVHHESFDYHWPHLSPREVPACVYLSSVGADGMVYYDQIVKWLEDEPEVRLIFQPGTVQIAQGVEALSDVYRRTQVLICNREEAVAIGGAAHGDLGAILESLYVLGPRLVVVTDGPDGAYAYDGSARLQVPSYPDPSPPMERTGAGDAFSSTLLAALLKGHTLAEALEWAPINAMSVVQEVGAQAGLLGEEGLLRLLKEAPECYAVRQW
jgi:sugar/nucleoside kinase (ribokinase family)